MRDRQSFVIEIIPVEDGTYATMKNTDGRQVLSVLIAPNDARAARLASEIMEHMVGEHILNRILGAEAQP